MDRRPRGSAHYKWTGEAASYRAAHSRVRKIRGKADHCIFGCTHPRYEWASLTGNYTDLDDYAPMCSSCHKRYDQARRSMEPGYSSATGWPQRIRYQEDWYRRRLVLSDL